MVNDLREGNKIVNTPRDRQAGRKDNRWED